MTCTTTRCGATATKNSFWGYGYGDIYAGIFAPYGYDDLTGYLPQYTSSNPSDAGQTANGTRCRRADRGV